MKKTSTFLLVLIGYTLHAQPTITSSIEPVAGTSITTIYVDSSTVQPGNSGANQTWDFSAAVPLGLVRIDEWVSPATTPYDTAFPGASIAEKTTDTAGNDLYLYFNRNTSLTDLIGMGFDAAGYPAVMNYTNPTTYREYPMNYNGTVSDNFYGTSVIDFGPLSVTIYRYGTYYYVIDGWGTLITPIATYQNVLRIKNNQYLTDSIVYTGGVIPTTVVHTASTAYFWGTGDPGHVLNQFYIGYDTTTTDTSTTVTISASYQGDVSGIEDHFTLNGNSSSVYPNPAGDFASVIVYNPVSGNAESIIYDVTGREVAKTEATMTTGQPFRQAIPVWHLTAGLYAVKTICGERQWLAKMVVE